MKWLIFSCVIFSLSFKLSAQSVMPVSKSFNLSKDGAAKTTEMKLTSESNTNALMDSAIEKGKEVFKLQKNSGSPSDSLKTLYKIIDSIYKSLVDSVYNENLPHAIVKLNEEVRVRPLAMGGISNLENIKQSYGSLTAGLDFRMANYRITKNNNIGQHFISLLFSLKSATSPDSSSIQKTYMFPELNKRDFAIGYRWECRKKNNWVISPNVEFSFNKFSDTALKKNFVSQSLILGWRFRKAFIDSPINSFIEIFPYYSWIGVEKKYSEDYMKTMGEESIPRNFNSIGMNVSAQTTNGILFCNMKYIMNKPDKISNPDMKTFIYTIGTLLSL